MKKQNERDEINATRMSLPVYQYRDDLLDAIEQNQVLVVVGEVCVVNIVSISINTFMINDFHLFILF